MGFYRIAGRGFVIIALLSAAYSYWDPLIGGLCLSNAVLMLRLLSLGRARDHERAVVEVFE